MKFYFVAGERSGDLHGGNLIHSLNRHIESFECRGFGGDHMINAGMDLVVHYRELAFMGFVEVLANMATISGKIKQCKDDIIRYQPDVVVLIDYAGFNTRIAKFASRNNIKVFWYISPKVWAWNQGRALKLKSIVDRMFVILPFEKEFFAKYDWQVDYVGNPVLDAIKAHAPNKDFLKQNNFEEDKPLIAFLPGSRKQEVSLIVPLLVQVAKNFPKVQFGVATVDNLSTDHYIELKSLSNVKLIDKAAYDLLCCARAALVTSGTATLETALFKVPQVVVYKTSPISYRIAKNLIRVSFISLVNLIANKEVVKELIQNKANGDSVSNELSRLLNDEDYRKIMIGEYDQLIKTLDIGSSSDNTARLMKEYLINNN